MTTISVDALSYSYPDGTAALRDVSFTVAAQETIGIAGSNGAGKTTLLNHLCGYTLPQKGTVSIDATLISKNSLETIRKKVGVIFQNTDDQLFMSRVIDDVAFGLHASGVPHREAHMRALEQLRTLELEHLAEKPPFHLSQGQKRFVAFAGILVMHPQIIIMDEPTSDLDPRHRRMLINFVKSLQDTTRLIVSHDLDFLWDTCSRVLLMSDGTIVRDGPARAVLSDEKLLTDNCMELPLRLQRG